MVKRQQLGIIGHFAYGKDCLDGQTVKTKTLYQELSTAGLNDIATVDTALNAKNKLRLLHETVRCAFKCENIILLVSRGGLSVFLPLLVKLSRITGVHLYLDVIGGNTADLIKTHPAWLKYARCFQGIWAETAGARRQLEELGLSNVSVIPNFKRLDIGSREYCPGSPLRFGIFSRVMQEKGVSDAAKAIAQVREKLKRDDIFLEIWGPVDPGYREEFSTIQVAYKDFLHYNGVVDYGASGVVLRGCYALLFPTRWEGEGFPGTIVDAYAAGLPVLASDWNANSEIIENGKTGFVYPCKDVFDLASGVEWFCTHEEEVEAMSKICNEEAKKYLPDEWIKDIREKVGVNQ